MSPHITATQDSSPELELTPTQDETPDFEGTSTLRQSPDMERMSVPPQPPVITPPNNIRAAAVMETQASIMATDETDVPSTPRDEFSTPATPPPNPCSRQFRFVSHKQKWAPTRTPSWKLGPQHGSYVRNAVPFLLCVPGGPEWESLVTSLITLESLAPSRPVSALRKRIHFPS